MHFGAKLRYFKHDTEVESSPKCFFLARNLPESEISNRYRPFFYSSQTAKGSAFRDQPRPRYWAISSRF